MRKVNHFGIPTQIKQENEIYLADMNLYITDFTTSPNKIEFLRFEPESQMPELLKTVPHIAYEVSSIEEELDGAEILIEPWENPDGTKLAFIVEEGIPVELMQMPK